MKTLSQYILEVHTLKQLKAKRQSHMDSHHAVSNDAHDARVDGDHDDPDSSHYDDQDQLEHRAKRHYQASAAAHRLIKRRSKKDKYDFDKQL